MTCPKRMVYGPCGGVTAEGGCEVDAALPCPFVDAPTVRWDPSPGRPGAEVPPWAATRPLVLADLPTAPLSRAALLRSADLLADGVDAVLIGDHPGARVQFPPSYRALLLRDRGVAVWAGWVVVVVEDR